MYPTTAGYKENTTSKEAAESINASTLRAKALMAIVSSPSGLTADEVASQLNTSVLAIRPRISELRKQGLIEPSSLTRKNLSGKKARVWIRPVINQSTIFHNHLSGCKDCGSEHYLLVGIEPVCDNCYNKRVQEAILLSKKTYV